MKKKDLIDGITIPISSIQKWRGMQEAANMSTSGQKLIKLMRKAYLIFSIVRQTFKF